MNSRRFPGFRRVVRIACALFVFCAAQGVWAQFSLKTIPDSADIRREVCDTWFRETLSSVRRLESLIRYNDAGQIFRVSVEETSSSTAVAVVPYSDGEFPVTGRGSWVLYRDRKTGLPTHIRIYIAASPDIYLQLYPSGNKTTADLYLFGAWTARGVPVGLPFDNLYTFSVQKLFNLIEQTIFRGRVTIDPRLYSGNRQMIDVIRSRLSDFTYVDDAAYDESGMPVYIRDGSARADSENTLGVNCSGFVKWIGDGLIRPLTGSYLKIEPLKTHTVSVEGTRVESWLDMRDPNFGLDWTRNIACAVLSASEKRTIRYPDSGVDVRIEPFSAKTYVDGVSKKAVNAVGYLKDAGYQMELLKPLLCVLAATEPDRFFLGAVRVNYDGVQRVENASSQGVIPQFTHTVAFFPYFDEAGIFQVAVFESGQETTIEEFTARYPNDFIHLVRVKASGRFAPPTK